MYRLRSGNSCSKASQTASRPELQTTIEFRKRRRNANPLKENTPLECPEDSLTVNSLSPPKRIKSEQEKAMPVTRSSARKLTETTKRETRSSRKTATKQQSPLTPTKHQSPLTPAPTKHQSPLTPTLTKRRLPLKENNTPIKESCDLALDTTPCHVTSPKAPFTGSKSTTRRLRFPESSSLCKVKKSLHNAIPNSLLCREEQLTSLSGFVKSHLSEKRSGSLYISGAPGTGKTACLSLVLDQSHDLLGSAHIVTVNCMSMKQPQAIYSRIACELLGSKVAKMKNISSLQTALVKHITTSKNMIVIVLDEVDQLDSRGQDILYTIFEWPALPKSKLLLIGIANALDLTDRVLPRLQSHKCRPDLLNFPPYNKDQIVTILKDRLDCGGSSAGGGVVDPMAVQFCARKVAAVHGDVRKALDICRRAIEMVETQACCTTDRQSDKENKATPTDKPIRVTLRHIADVISEVYSSNISSQTSKHTTFPLQQKLVVCTLLCMVKGFNKKESTLGKLYDSYVKVCRHRRLRYEGESEFAGLCEMLETRGIIVSKKARENRDTKLTLKLEESELEHALQDKLLITSVLEHGIPT